MVDESGDVERAATHANITDSLYSNESGLRLDFVSNRKERAHDMRPIGLRRISRLAILKSS
jgi:hypothetical protein